jgi:hypothetical protein
MKVFRLLSVLFAMVLAGCGNGSIHSPDFRPVFVGFTSITPQPASVPIGGTITFTADGTYTVPPGAPAATPVVISGASWSIDNTAVATINSSGVATGVSQGTATVTASMDGQTITATLTVAPPQLQSIIIVNPADPTDTPITAQTIELNSTASYQALGIYSDSPKPRNIDGTVNWTSSVPTVATVSPVTGAITTATASATTTGNTVITATVVTANGTTTGSLTLTVTASTLTGLNSAATLNPPQIAPTFTSQATAIGIYQNGSQQALPNDGSTVTWSSSLPAIATINSTTGIATGVAAGQSTITATLLPAFQSTNNTATAVLTVTNPECPQPLLATAPYNATVSDATGGICLLCGTTNDSNIIDGNFTNYATMSVPVGLLGGSESVTVATPTTITPVAGQYAGFIIGRPAGTLVTAEIESQIQVSTQLNGVATGDSSGPTIPLRLDLLGQELTGAQAALATLQPTKPFNSITLTFSSALATALSTVQVYGACATAVPP